MVMLLFNPQTGDIKEVGYCEGWEARKMKARLEKQGYKVVAKEDGRFASFIYTSYFCKTCNKYECDYETYGFPAGVSKYKELRLILVKTISDCKYKSLIYRIPDGHLSTLRVDYLAFENFVKKMLTFESAEFLLNLLINMNRKIKKLIRESTKFLSDDEKFKEFIEKMKNELIKSKL